MTTYHRRYDDKEHAEDKVQDYKWENGGERVWNNKRAVMVVSDVK